MLLTLSTASRRWREALRREWRRFALATGVGLALAAYSVAFWGPHRAQPSDLAQSVWAAELLWEGKNPYANIGPGLLYPQAYPLFYPLPAAAAMLPLAGLPQIWIDALFVGFGAAVLFLVLSRNGLANPQLLALASYPMLVTAQTSQWSPWVTAAALTPSLGWILACKPSLGAALWLAFPSRRSLLLAAGFTVVTIALWPWWVADWLAALPAARHMSAPLMRPWGFLLLLAFIKWRRPEARLLGVLAVLPQTPSLYDAVPLFLVVRTIEEGVALVVLTSVMGGIVGALPASTDYHTWMATNGEWMVYFLYLPCLVMVLRRPNVAAPVATADQALPRALSQSAPASGHRP